MYKVKIKYNMFETQTVMKYLYANQVEICKSTDTHATIKVHSKEYLSKLLEVINKRTVVGVTILKIKRCFW